jgi:hypothetical protein
MQDISGILRKMFKFQNPPCGDDRYSCDAFYNLGIIGHGHRLAYGELSCHQGCFGEPGD